MRLRFLILLLIPMISNSAFAQDTPPASAQIIVGQNVAQFQWLPDSSELRIIEGIFPEQKRQEVSYNIALQPLDENIVLTQDLETANTLMGQSGLINAEASVIYSSPNQQWSVSTTVHDEQNYLTIRHIPTEREYVIRDIRVAGPFSANHFRVRWSDDSSAFYVSISNNPMIYWYYVSNFTHVLEDVAAVLLNDQRGEGIVNQAIGEVIEVFDIDAQGDSVLLRRNTRVENEPGVVTQLVTLNMKTLKYRILMTSTSGIAGARFGQEGEIYYVNAQGLSVYDLTNSTSQLLDATINSNWAITAEISPDGRYVAAIEPGGSNIIYIVVVTPQ
jgi:hypothetical protein